MTMRCGGDRRPDQSSAARRSAALADGSGISFVPVAAVRVFPVAVAEIGRQTAGAEVPLAARAIGSVT